MCVWVWKQLLPSLLLVQFIQCNYLVLRRMPVVLEKVPLCFEYFLAYCRSGCVCICLVTLKVVAVVSSGGGSWSYFSFADKIMQLLLGFSLHEDILTAERKLSRVNFGVLHFEKLFWLGIEAKDECRSWFVQRDLKLTLWYSEGHHYWYQTV